MTDEPREVFPYRSYDRAKDKSPLDFRIQMGTDPEPEEEAVDPKDLSAPELVTSSGMQLTIDEIPEKTASVVRDTGKAKANGTGKQTSSAVN